MLPAGLGIAMEGADVLLQEGTGPLALPGAAALRNGGKRDRDEGLGLQLGAFVLWLQQFNQYMNDFFRFKSSKGCRLWPCFGESED